MPESYIGEIQIFAGNFAPRDWAFCEGQLLPISQNTALFSIIGTYYGGDGKSTFALPDLRGAAPMNQGNGAGLTPRMVGEIAGKASVTLTPSQMPTHTHIAQAVPTTGNSEDPADHFWAESQGSGRPPQQNPYYGTNADVSMSPNALSPSGGSLPHNNRQPYLAVSFIICLQGVYPSRN